MTRPRATNPDTEKPTAFTETYGYSQAGQKTNKGLQITQYLTEQDQWGINHSGPATLDLESVYTYDTEARMTSVQSPGGYYGYGYDTMERLSTMTNLNTSSSIITGTTYDPANRLLSISGNLNESRTYNVMGQLTQITSGWYGTPMLNVSYNYSSTQNNGKVASQTDHMSGEQVVYAYDALNRLASAGATNSSWGQSYAYDGFGNLLDQTVTAGTAPSLSVVYNAATNQQTTDCTDANGNVLGATVGGNCYGPSYSYDAKNRISAAAGGTMFYTYAPDNKRVWRYGTDGNGTQTSSEIAFWSVTGKKLFTCNLTPGTAVLQNNVYVEILNCPIVAANSYFGGKLISNGILFPVQDRLGSIGKFYPWGQEKPSATTNNTEKFTGYFRDSETGLDYADQRYHQPGMGRFLSVDRGAPTPNNPGSWNRYAYVQGDPVNSADHSGLFSSAEDCAANPEECQVEDASGTSLICAAIAANPFSPEPVPPICYEVASAVAAAEDPTITCGDTLSENFSPSQVGFDLLSTVVMRILNENSFGYLGTRSLQAGNTLGHGTGPTITFASLAYEDVAIASVIINLGMTPNSGFNGTLSSAMQGTSGFANANKIANAQTLNGSPDSDKCKDIAEAITAAQTVLYGTGSQLPMYYNQWRGVLQNGIVYPPGACGFQIDNTKFINGTGQPCTP